MACATLKRSLDFEPVLGGSRPPKRRRCMPFSSGSSASPGTSTVGGASPSASSSGLAGPSTPTNRFSASPYLSYAQSPASSSSIFPDVVRTKFTPEYMAAHIRAELKRYQRQRKLAKRLGTEDKPSPGVVGARHHHRQIITSGAGDLSPSSSDAENSSGGESPPRVESLLQHGVNVVGGRGGGPATSSVVVRKANEQDRPIFTFKQVGAICERMLKEKESEIREEYEMVLMNKLAEQYDSFVKFTHDQIQQNYSNVTPSYLS